MLQIRLLFLFLFFATMAHGQTTKVGVVHDAEPDDYVAATQVEATAALPFGVETTGTVVLAGDNSKWDRNTLQAAFNQLHGLTDEQVFMGRPDRETGNRDPVTLRAIINLFNKTRGTADRPGHILWLANFEPLFRTWQAWWLISGDPAFWAGLKITAYGSANMRWIVRKLPKDELDQFVVFLHSLPAGTLNIFENYNAFENEREKNSNFQKKTAPDLADLLTTATEPKLQFARDVVDKWNTYLADAFLQELVHPEAHCYKDYAKVPEKAAKAMADLACFQGFPDKLSELSRAQWQVILDRKDNKLEGFVSCNVLRKVYTWDDEAGALVRNFQFVAADASVADLVLSEIESTRPWLTTSPSSGKEHLQYWTTGRIAFTEKGFTVFTQDPTSPLGFYHPATFGVEPGDRLLGLFGTSIAERLARLVRQTEPIDGVSLMG